MHTENPFSQGIPEESLRGDQDNVFSTPKESSFIESGHGAFDSMSSREKTLTAKEQYENLTKRNTNFIFFFGKPAAGKSHMMASLIHYMKTCDLGDLIISKNNRRDAHLLVQDMFESIHNGTYLNRTASQIGGTEPPTEIDLIFKPKDSRLPVMKFTFLEMSGENLELVQVRNDNLQSGKLPDTIETYLNCPNLKLSFFLLAGHEEAQRDGQVIDSFLDYLTQKDDKFERYRYLLAITKWDTYRGEFKESVEEFVDKFMPHIYQRLIKEGTINALINYSLGIFQKIQSNGIYTDVLVKADNDKASRLTEWMYQHITGKSLIPKPGFWIRIRRFLGI